MIITGISRKNGELHHLYVDDGGNNIKLAPVVRGQWILIAENSTGLIYQCSACGKCNNPNEDDVSLGRAKEKPDFCPNCGADMKEKT